MILEYYIK